MPANKRKRTPRVPFSPEITPRSSHSKKSTRFNKPLESSDEPEKSEHEELSSPSIQQHYKRKPINSKGYVPPIVVTKKEELWTL